MKRIVIYNRELKEMSQINLIHSLVLYHWLWASGAVMRALHMVATYPCGGLAGKDGLYLLVRVR